MKPVSWNVLEQAKSNIPEHGDGRRIYEKFVKPAMVDLAGVGACYACVLFSGSPRNNSPCTVTPPRQEFFKSAQIGRTKLAIGRVRIMSTITWESERFCFGAIHWGDYNVSGCLRPCQGADELEAHFVQEVFDSFNRGEFPASLQALEQSLGTALLFPAEPVSRRSAAHPVHHPGAQPGEHRRSLPPSLRRQCSATALP